MRADTILIPICLFLLGLVIAGTMIHAGLTSEIGTSQVDCYDEYRNKIIDAECEKEITNLDKMGMIVIGFICLAFFTITSFFLMKWMIDIDKYLEED